jgi:hypothetical protein
MTATLQHPGFVAHTRAFEDVIGERPQLRLLVEVDAHEGPTYVADENTLYFTTVPRRRADGSPHVAIKRMIIEEPEHAETVVPDANAANGKAASADGGLVCEQGTPSEPARISRPAAGLRRLPLHLVHERGRLQSDRHADVPGVRLDGVQRHVRLDRLELAAVDVGQPIARDQLGRLPVVAGGRRVTDRLRHQSFLEMPATRTLVQVANEVGFREAELALKEVRNRWW